MLCGQTVIPRWRGGDCFLVKQCYWTVLEPSVLRGLVAKRRSLVWPTCLISPPLYVGNKLRKSLVVRISISIHLF